MKKRKYLSALLMAAAVCTAAVPACQEVSATSVGDVIAYARSVGMPEEQVQYYINMGSGREYTSEQCDAAIAYLASYYASRDEAIGGGEQTSETVEHIEPEEFEAMDVHDKKDYVNSLPSDDKKEYLDLMTSDEKNQLVKEMDPSEQVNIISSMLGVGDAFGYQFTVEDVSDGAIMLSARDDDGKLVGVTVLGDSVEKTGKPYTVPLAVCGGLIFFSAAGMAVMIGKCR